VTEQAGLAKVDDGNYGMGVAVGDYDNDGYPIYSSLITERIFCITTMATEPSRT